MCGVQVDKAAVEYEKKKLRKLLSSKTVPQCDSVGLDPFDLCFLFSTLPLFTAHSALMPLPDPEVAG